MANLSKHAFGSKDNIETAKEAGKIDEFDIIFMDNGEIGWVDGEKQTIINTPRTQKAHTLNGVSLGALEDGDTVPTNTTFDELVELITKKAIPAEYGTPSVSLSNNGGQSTGNVEAGTSITPALKATFTQSDAGALKTIVIKRGGEEVETGTTSPLTYSGDAFTIGDETVIYTATASYEAAPVKQNNLGQDSLENWYGSGSVTSRDYNITGKRNLFYGTGVGSLPTISSDVVRGLTNTKLAPTQGYSFNITVDVGQQYIIVAYPATLRDINNITYVEANDGGMVSNFTKSTLDVADARGGDNGKISYKVYTYTMAVPAAATMTFKVTI